MILNFKISVECLILWNYGSFHDIRKVRTCNYTYQVTRILPASFRISTSCKQRRIGHLFDSINFKKVEFLQQSTGNRMFHFWKLISAVNFVAYKESLCIINQTYDKWGGLKDFIELDMENYSPFLVYLSRKDVNRLITHREKRVLPVTTIKLFEKIFLEYF